MPKGNPYVRSYPFPRLKALRWKLSPTHQLRRITYERGVRGDSKAVFYLFIGLSVASVVRRQIAKQPERVAVETLKPGESVTIRALSRDEARRPISR